MNIKAYKKYRFSHGTLTATDTGNVYNFYIDSNDRFHQYMEKYIIKEKIEELSHENIDNISIDDVDKTFFSEKTFTLNVGMFVTDKNNIVQLYMLTIKNVQLQEKNYSTKSYDNGSWRLGLYSLELPYNTDVNIVEVVD